MFFNYYNKNVNILLEFGLLQFDRLYLVISHIIVNKKYVILVWTKWTLKDIFIQTQIYIYMYAITVFFSFLLPFFSYPLFAVELVFLI